MHSYFLVGSLLLPVQTFSMALIINKVLDIRHATTCG
jgi:hypothetical protein